MREFAISLVFGMHKVTVCAFVETSFMSFNLLI